MAEVTRTEFNGLGKRVGDHIEAYSKFMGNVEARMTSVEQATQEFKTTTDLLKTGQNKIIGAIIAINGFSLFLVAAASIYLSVRK